MNTTQLFNELEFIENYMMFSPGFRRQAQEYLVDYNYVVCYDDLVTITNKGEEYLREFREANTFDSELIDSGIDESNIEMENPNDY